MISRFVDDLTILFIQLNRPRVRLVVEVRVAHEAEAAVLAVRRDGGVERLSSEIKDEISSKLASALRALKSRISRICGINELERRTVPSQNKHESTYIHDLRNDQNY